MSPDTMSQFSGGAVDMRFDGKVVQAVIAIQCHTCARKAAMPRGILENTKFGCLLSFPAPDTPGREIAYIFPYFLI